MANRRMSVIETEKNKKDQRRQDTCGQFILQACALFNSRWLGWMVVIAIISMVICARSYHFGVAAWKAKTPAKTTMIEL
jgi:hypothetical protein